MESSSRLVGLILCLRAARSLLGWSQAQLSEQSGISRAALNRLERFDNEPRLDTVLRIEEALAAAGVSIERRGDGGYAVAVTKSAIDAVSSQVESGDSAIDEETLHQQQKKVIDGETAAKALKPITRSKKRK